MSSRIVIDSSGDLLHFNDVDFASVPLKILAGEKEFVDNDVHQTQEMIRFLKDYKGKTTTSCPGVGEYMEAFGDADHVYCVTITSNLSGSYNAAEVAARAYLEQYPDRKVHVFDSLSCGPEMALLAEKIRDLLKEKIPFESIIQSIKSYQQKTRLIFTLESLHNLANNGRVSGTVAALAGMLGIRMIGKASDAGTLQPIGKARGEKKLVPEIVKHLKEMGYNGGKVRIDHCENETSANRLRELILSLFPSADISIGVTGALCSFYAEHGGMLIGFEVA